MPEPAAAGSAPSDRPAHRYDAVMAARIELDWQARWERDGTFHTANPVGPLVDGFDRVAGRPPLFVLDMFPYPSDTGLHVGHPLGFIGTDVYARYKRMTGYNVLHTMGFDAFGLPAEQYAVQTGQHPRVTTEANVANMRRQLGRLGLGHDPRRSIATTDPAYYRWTQWIFLQIFNSWYDIGADRARPVEALAAELDAGDREPDEGTNPFGRPWAELTVVERRQVIDAHRLAYLHEAPVNWCPGLGTVLANEEVTAERRSDRGNFPVYRRPLKQWMLRITAYADRLLGDLDTLDWPDSIKLMQRNWIGRSTGAAVRFGSTVDDIEVFTTRPDTLFGATYLVLAPEHPLVDALAAAHWPDATPPSWTGGATTPAEGLSRYREEASRRSDLERQADTRKKTGVFTGSFATNPVNEKSIPVFVADYVLMGYGTGAIMAVPGQDQRDSDFAAAFDLPVVRTVQPPTGFDGEAYVGDGPAINSGFLDGLDIAEAKAATISWLDERGAGRGTITYKLRDWLFSRQRYWGEPFPIVYDEDDLPRAVPESELPVLLPEIEDYAPVTSADESSMPEPPLGRASHWVEVTLDLGEGPKVYRREVNTMPQWAGSCWYELRYLDPTNERAFCDPEVERYWMGPRRSGDSGGVDLYVGGVEHAVLHLLYARFWHKVLYDLGHVSSFEPYHRLFNQGYVLADAFKDARGLYVSADAVVRRNGAWFLGDDPVTPEHGKMGKSLRNGVTPDDMYDQYGADTLRLYEMFTGPLDQSRPWDTKAVVGVYRLLQRIWRNLIDEDTGASRVTEESAPEETRRILHRTIVAVRDGMETLRFNTSIAKLTELNNHVTAETSAGTPREIAEPLVLMLAPLAPHIAEELWGMLGHDRSLAWEPFPEPDARWLTVDSIEIPVQVDGRFRAKVTVSAEADDAAIEAAAWADERIVALLRDRLVVRVVVVPGRLINFVLG